MVKQFLEKKERKVEYIELIYDLIFVYIIGRNNLLLHHTTGGYVSRTAFISYILCTLAIIQIWTFTTYYINVYGKKSVREHIFLFINMFLLYFMAKGIDNEWEQSHTIFHVAWALILINIGVQYLLELRTCQDAAYRRRIKGMMAVLFTEAVIVAASIAEFHLFGTTFASFAAVLCGIVMVLIFSKNSCKAVVDFNHLSERAMLYVVFTFGEMIIAIASYFEGKLTPSKLYFAVLAFFIVVGLFLSYGVFYDHLIDKQKQTNAIGYMLIHLFLIFSLNNITNALEFMRESEVDLMQKTVLLVFSFSSFYVSLFLAGMYAKKGLQPNKKIVLLAALITLVFIGLMIGLRKYMYVNIALSVVYVFSMFFFIINYKNKLIKANQ